jgi:autoinducer 2-degrading protein
MQPFIVIIAMCLVASTYVNALLPPLGRTIPPWAKPTRRASTPFVIVVEANIDINRMDEFLKIIEVDAVGSRNEPGCLRFDVVQSQEDPAKFFFYEMYTNSEAVAFHKLQPHYLPWTQFKDSGGVIKSVSHKTHGLFVS